MKNKSTLTTRIRKAATQHPGNVHETAIKSLSILALILGVLVSGCASQGVGPTTNSPRHRLQIAEAMLQERCKTAGEKVNKWNK